MQKTKKITRPISYRDQLRSMAVGEVRTTAAGVDYNAVRVAISYLQGVGEGAWSSNSRAGKCLTVTRVK